LCRQVCRFAPAALVLVEQAENSLFHIHRQLQQEFPHIRLIPAVADVCDSTRVGALLRRHRPAVIFHAAAHKHVPMMEWNPGEAVKNNVLGTRTLADLAHEHGVREFVMVSTDKAVNPTSVMGVSKRVAELYIQALAQRSRTRFVTVRFGNVLGSAGSVIPIFREQIARGGPVTVTHPEMKRYFMTIPEACQLILEAASLGRGGEIFILDMGEPVKIVDLAADLIRLSGLTPGKEIAIRFTGMRPGEKLYEELTLTDENADRTRHPRIFTGRLKVQEWERIRRQVEELLELADCGDGARIRAKFKEMVPEYAYQPSEGTIRTDEPHRPVVPAGLSVEASVCPVAAGVP
jgi:FlaA1/EpsC-like NDP-sugar epimerase